MMILACSCIKHLKTVSGSVKVRPLDLFKGWSLFALAAVAMMGNQDQDNDGHRESPNQTIQGLLLVQEPLILDALD